MEKPLKDFYKHPQCRDGYDTRCKQCGKEYSRAWRAANPGVHTELKRQWNADNRQARNARARELYQANPSAAKARTRRYLASHPGLAIAKTRRWRTLNPAAYKACVHRRRARMKAAGIAFTGQEWLDLCARYGNRCLRCGKVVKLTPDHVIPISKGGTNAIDNIQPLCQPCNSGKRDKSTDYRVSPFPYAEF